MACFLVPTAEAIAAAIITKAVEAKEQEPAAEDSLLPKASVADGYALGRLGPAGLRAYLARGGYAVVSLSDGGGQCGGHGRDAPRDVHGGRIHGGPCNGGLGLHGGRLKRH